MILYREDSFVCWRYFCVQYNTFVSRRYFNNTKLLLYPHDIFVYRRYFWSYKILLFLKIKLYPQYALIVYTFMYTFPDTFTPT